MLGVFQQPLGLSEAWGMILPFAAIICWAVFFMLRRQQKLRGVAAPVPVVPPSRQKIIRAVSLFLMVVVSLSSPWWLPVTGTRLPFPQMVIVAIITCITCVTIYLIASRGSAPKA